MSNEFNEYENSRLDRFEKRRKNTKAISLLVVTGSILVVALIALFIFGGDDDNDQQASSANAETESDGDQTTTEEDDSNDVEENEDVEQSTENENEPSVTEENNNEQESKTETSPTEQEDVDLVEVESDDENVITAYTGNWSPIGTNQEEPHEISWDDESEDWNELMTAVRLAVKLDEGDMIDWWVAGNGPNSVIATVTNKAQTENYRVYASWVTNEGWQVTKVEILKENDQKQRFEDGNGDEEAVEESEGINEEPTTQESETE